MRYFYTALFYLVLPFILLCLWWRGRSMPAYRKRWRERFGKPPFQLETCIWVHAVSVGETIAAVPLIKKLQLAYPTLPLVVTSMTATGAARVKAIFGDTVLHAFIPYDLPGAIARFLSRLQPKMAIIMETELWPNLFAACKQRGIPIVVTNARLSAQSANGYKKIASLTRDMLSAVQALAAQGQADAKRFIDLGLPRENLIVTGNLKFDLEMPPFLAEKSAALQQQLSCKGNRWIAASTDPAEEKIILAAHRAIRSTHPNALLIFVPRHPERFEAVAALCEKQGFHVARRSRGDVCSEQTDIYLGDTMGELLLLYSVAEVAFVGGSFVSVGGHNMLEPAALQKPIITGPILFNFYEISEMLLKANGMLIVNNGEELARQVSDLFTDPLRRKKMGENAYQVIEANRGALTKQIELIMKVCP